METPTIQELSWRSIREGQSFYHRKERRPKQSLGAFAAALKSKSFIEPDSPQEKGGRAEKQKLAAMFTGKTFSPLEEQCSNPLPASYRKNSHAANVQSITLHYGSHSANRRVILQCHPYRPLGETSLYLVASGRGSCEGLPCIGGFILDKGLMEN